MPWSPGSTDCRRPSRRSTAHWPLEENVMTDAQMGLVVATPAIIVMALLLYRMGVLQKGGVAVAITMSLAIAVLLFLEQ
jgi:ABC-type nickel/cobalt efflux system permease component RcnA